MYYYGPILQVITMAKTNKQACQRHQDALANWLEFFSFGVVRVTFMFDASISPFPDYGLSTKLIPSDLPSWDHFDWSWLWLCVT